MTSSAGMSGISSEPIDPGDEPRSEETPARKAARLWVHQFARALKTCRLYEQNINATVERLLDEVTGTLRRFHEEHGTLALEFTADDVLYDGASTYLARSRDDNLALPFYRDGIRGLAFHAGTTRDQIEALIAAIIRVTALSQTDDDLVTLLWEAHLDHVDIDYVPAEGDVNAGAELDDDEPMPWPEPEPDPSQVVSVEEGSPEEAAGPRSDDWTMRELTTEVEAGFAELESLAPSEVQRFHAEYQAEHQVPVTTTAIAVIQAYLASGGAVLDTSDLGRFIPRVLREALAHGSWLEATEAVSLVAHYGGDYWSKETFVQELMQPISIANISARLDGQDVEAALDFIEFARTLGDTDIDVLVAVLAHSESRRNRRILSEAVIKQCRDNPERLAPWLADPRWFVVRNIVHMLGSIGGEGVVGLLESVLRHPEPRVRYAVVASLSQAPARAARPLLLAMLEQADTRTFCSVLQVLAGEPDPALVRRMYQLMQDPEFEKRPGPEKRAVYQTIASSGSDEIVADLEAELYRGGWFPVVRDEHVTAIARCLARIGTLLSMQALERGAQSRRATVRRACEEALLGWAPHE